MSTCSTEEVSAASSGRQASAAVQFHASARPKTCTSRQLHMGNADVQLQGAVIMLAQTQSWQR